jgi:PBP1b-binding outer membrane lipoprotein LpoB
MERIIYLFILALALGGCVTYTGARSYVNDTRRHFIVPLKVGVCR